VKDPDPVGWTDSELLRLSGKRNQNAFLALYRRHQGVVFRYALHMSGRRDVAEEVTQETFIALLGETNAFKPERGSVQGYLIGIARNRVRKHLAELNRWVDDTEIREEISSVFEQADKEQELNALREAILSLPANYREVLVLCDLEGLDYADAAGQLGCPVGTVRSRLHRARGILASKLRRKSGCSV
jgi:RNA polymerase sigma-70 factor (ECF subfamily)